MRAASRGRREQTGPSRAVFLPDRYPAETRGAARLHRRPGFRFEDRSLRRPPVFDRELVPLPFRKPLAIPAESVRLVGRHPAGTLLALLVAGKFTELTDEIMAAGFRDLPNLMRLLRELFFPRRGLVARIFAVTVLERIVVEREELRERLFSVAVLIKTGRVHLSLRHLWNDGGRQHGGACLAIEFHWIPQSQIRCSASFDPAFETITDSRSVAGRTNGQLSVGDNSNRCRSEGFEERAALMLATSTSSARRMPEGSYWRRCRLIA